MSSGPYLQVDLGALARNYRRIGAASRPSTVAAVVKGDAYGLGVAPVAAALADAGCRDYFVATAREGAELRTSLGNERQARIFVLDGLLDDDVTAFTECNLLPVLNSTGQVKRWSNAGPAALHVDTGMNRLGLAAGEFADVARSSVSGWQIELLMTHLACADDPEHPLNRAQLELFSRLRVHLPDVPVSIGNSAGALLSAASRGDIVRAGIGLYGANPFLDRKNPVEPVASLHAPVIQLRRLQSAQTVGYGAEFVGREQSVIATIALGYADGYLRALGNCGVASIAGTRVPVVGRVSMDLLCLDVTAVSADKLAEGVDVELFGYDVSIDELAHDAGTISYELLTGLGRRVERRYTPAIPIQN